MRHGGGAQEDTPRRRPSRRHVVPSALLHDPTFVGTFDGYAIVREVPNGDAAFALFQIYRAVMLWARTEPEDRDRMFAPDFRDHVLASAYIGLGQQLDGVHAACWVFASDDAGARDRVTAGCTALAAAAANEGWYATALALHIAAACVNPEEAGAALAVGRIAIRAQRSAVADMWLRRAVVLGRRQRAWAVVGRAYLELAGIALRAGGRRRGDARRLLALALYTARRRRLREVAAEAADQLHRLAREAGELETAERFARRAIRAYAPGRAQMLVRESLAEMRLAARAPGDAVALLESVLAAAVDEPGDRVRSLTMIVAALASAPGPAQPIRIRRYSEEAATLIADAAPGDRPAAVRALLALSTAVRPADKSFADLLRRQALGLARHTEDAALIQEARFQLAPGAGDQAAGAA